ncbi:hypothetical protein Tco_0843129 [Tanacetum coccineum]|uniref:Uncharacterized protein n=1 Tax=Tanacetum coccineum TaxID=301880 RepID=A0ABQ5B4R6_9ASTR
MSKKIVWVRWQKILADEKDGGLGVGCIKAKNMSLLGKWRRRYLNEAGLLWRKVISKIHGSDDGFETIIGSGHKASVWANIIGCCSELNQMGISHSNLMVKKVSSVADRWSLLNGVWQVIWAWRRQPRGRALDELSTLSSLISGLVLDMSREDIWSWSLDESGEMWRYRKKKRKIFKSANKSTFVYSTFGCGWSMTQLGFCLRSVCARVTQALNAVKGQKAEGTSTESIATFLKSRVSENLKSRQVLLIAFVTAGTTCLQQHVLFGYGILVDFHEDGRIGIISEPQSALKTNPRHLLNIEGDSESKSNLTRTSRNVSAELECYWPLSKIAGFATRVRSPASENDSAFWLHVNNNINYGAIIPKIVKSHDETRGWKSIGRVKWDYLTEDMREDGRRRR